MIFTHIELKCLFKWVFKLKGRSIKRDWKASQAMAFLNPLSKFWEVDVNDILSKRKVKKKIWERGGPPKKTQVYQKTW